MNTIKGMIEDLNNKNTHICGCTTVGELIIALERLQMLEEPQPNRGKWIEVEVHNCHATLKCSECDRVIEPTYTFGEYSYEDIKTFYPYCHCGARMDADMREVQDD